MFSSSYKWFYRDFQRFFGIIRSCGGGESKPTVSSFLQLFRLLSLYYPTKEALRGSNVDSRENAQLLMSYHDWLKKRYKSQSKGMSELKNYVKDILFSNMKSELLHSFEMDDVASKNDNVVFYIGGYLLSRYYRRNKNTCSSCVLTMDGSMDDFTCDEFSARKFTELKSRGKLKFPTTNMFALLKKIEYEVGVFCNSGQIYDSNAFIDILYTLSDQTLPQVGCEEHHKSLMTNFIYDYLLTRFKFIGRQKKFELMEKTITKKHTHNKLAKGV